VNKGVLKNKIKMRDGEDAGGNGWTCVSCSYGCMCMLLIWVYMREYTFGVYDVDDGREVYFDGLEGPYSVVEGECCRRGMRKEY
jgi:hypothetical protein